MLRKPVDAEGNSRLDRIFDLIVQSYIETAEPVGSRTISRRYDVGLSPASIRSIMADLEEQGLLAQPHTSAGRVPTDRGYRHWVDSLMEPEEMKEPEKERVVRELHSARTVEALLAKVSKVVSDLTGNAAVVYFRKLKRVSFLNYVLEELIEDRRLGEFLEEEAELAIEGTFRVFDQPEFHDLDKMRMLLQAFDEKEILIGMLAKNLEETGVQVHIGRENHLGYLDHVSFVVKDCYAGDTPIGGVAVVGPTRMRYPRVVAIVDFVADSVTEAVSRF